MLNMVLFRHKDNAGEADVCRSVKWNALT